MLTWTIFLNSKRICFTVHGNNLLGDSGQIASPFYPKPHVQAGTYKWTIAVSNRKVVQITFSDFYVDRYSNDYCSNYVQVMIKHLVQQKSFNRLLKDLVVVK